MFLKFISGIFLLVVIAMALVAGGFVRERGFSLEEARNFVEQKVAETHSTSTSPHSEATEQKIEQKSAPVISKSPESKPAVTPVAAKKPAPPPITKPLVYGGDGEGVLTSAGVLQWTNKNRATGNLSPLSRNSLLDTVAIIKMNDMFKRGYFEHESPDGKDVVDLSESVGYRFVSVGENLALGNFGSDQSLVQAWMDSPGHRENIMKPNFQEIGIAVGEGTFNGKKTWIAVQEFGRPISACANLDESLPVQIKGNNIQIAEWKKEASARRAELDGMSEFNPLYNEKVKEYNELAARINALIEETSALATKYNAQVKAYNACVAE